MSQKSNPTRWKRQLYHKSQIYRVEFNNQDIKLLLST